MAAVGNGFIAVRHLDGSQTFRTEWFPIDDSNPKPIFQRHAVVLSSGKVVEHTSTGTTSILGVVKAVGKTPKGRMLTHNLPATGNFLGASAAGWAEVYIDPDIIYQVETDSAMTMQAVGQLCDIVVDSSGNPDTGISRMQLDGNTIAAESSANVLTLPFRVVGAPAMEEKAFALSANGYDMGVGSSARALEVIINDHLYRSKRGHGGS